ncbi:MAG: hypothetical protein U0K91_02400 [Acutalibacteraceae bacterium]|nr:hypothetical protein [Acutalibacteraceae bacterium]
MVKTFSDIFTEDVAKFCDTLNPIVKPNADELFNVHEDEEVDIPEIPEKDTPSDEPQVQAQPQGLSDDDINRIAQAILKIQAEQKGE